MHIYAMYQTTYTVIFTCIHIALKAISDEILMVDMLNIMELYVLHTKPLHFDLIVSTSLNNSRWEKTGI